MEQQKRRKDSGSLNRRGNERTSSSSSVPTSLSSETPSFEGRNSESEGRTNDTEHHKKLVLLKLPHNEAEEEDSPKERRGRSTLRRRSRRSKEKTVKCSCGVGTEPYSFSRMLEREQIASTYHQDSKDPRRVRETIRDAWEDDFYTHRRSRTSSTSRAEKIPQKIRFYTWAISRSLTDPKRFMKVSLRELLIYSLFLFFFTWVAMGAKYNYRNIYCHVIMNVFTKTLYSTNASVDAVTPTTGTYYSIKTVQDVWTYLIEHFSNVFYFYNIEDRIRLTVPKLDSEKVLYKNIVVGAARLRQVRVRNDSCTVPSLFKTWFNECYNYYHHVYEEKGSYGPGYIPEYVVIMELLFYLTILRKTWPWEEPIFQDRRILVVNVNVILCIILHNMYIVKCMHPRVKTALKHLSSWTSSMGCRGPGRADSNMIFSVSWPPLIDSLQTKIFDFCIVSNRWSWQNTKDEVSYSGKVSIYSPDGYFVDLTKRFYVENKTLHELRSSGWINRATRALLLEFVAYSPNTNLFAVIKMVMELPPGGGVIPTADCYSMQLISYTGPMDIINVIFAFIIILYIIYFICLLSIDVKYFGWPYLFTFWGMLDLTKIILLLLLFAIAIFREVIVHLKLPELVKNIEDDNYGSFDKFALMQKYFYGVLGLTLIIAWIKLVKFFTMFSTVAVLFIAIGKSKLHLMALSMIGIILLIGFAMGAHIFFGVYIEEFSTVESSIYTLLTIPVGGLHFYEDLYYYRPIVAPIFLSAFIFVFILSLFSLFVAVVVYGFERAEEKRILTAPKRKYGFYEYFLNIGAAIFYKIKCRKVSKKMEEKERSIELKKDHELIVSMLARHGLRGEEMKLFLQKHGISESYETSEYQLTRMYYDLKTKLLLEKEVATHNELRNEIESLHNQLEEVQVQAKHLSSKGTVDRKKTE